jgi:Penicillin binding protein transpeptidase domain
MLRTVVTSGTGRLADVEGLSVAGKTGTSSSYRDAWFVGFSGDYITGLWMGNDDAAPMREVTGGTLPAKAFRTIMAATPALLALNGDKPRPLFGVAIVQQAGAQSGDNLLEALPNPFTPITPPAFDREGKSSGPSEAARGPFGSIHGPSDTIHGPSGPIHDPDRYADGEHGAKAMVIGNDRVTALESDTKRGIYAIEPQFTRPAHGLSLKTMALLTRFKTTFSQAQQSSLPAPQNPVVDERLASYTPR